jgi:glycosyltransferase involved in cell wall biosynthesis
MTELNYNFLKTPIQITEHSWDENIIPYVHVWIPAFNHEKFITKAIESILEQRTTFPVKILIHDDASIDNTANLIRQFEKKYPTIIKAFYQKINSFKFENSHLKDEFNSWRIGKYEANCEGDDYWIDPFKLQKQVEYLEQNNLDFIYSDIDILFEATNKIKKNVFKNNFLKDYKKVDEFIINFGYKAPCTWLYKKEIYKELTKEERASIDPSFLIMAKTMLNKKVGYLESSTAVYRILDNSLTNTKRLSSKYDREIKLLNVQKQFEIYFDDNFKSKVQRAAFVRLFFMQLALFHNTFDQFLNQYENCVYNFKPKTKRELLIKLFIPNYRISAYFVRTYFKLMKYKL